MTMSTHKIATMHRLQLRKTPPPKVANVSVTLNPAALAKIRARPHTGCGPKEVAPDVFTHIDCTKKYTPVTKAKIALASRRLKLFKTGKLSVDQGVGGGTPKDHPVGDGTPAVLPAEVDHRKDGSEGPVKDQGVVGSCTGFSLSTTMDNAVRRLGKQDVISPMHVWSHYAIPSMGEAGDGNIQKPIAIFADYPYDQKIACGMYKGLSEFSCGEYFNPPVQSGGAAFNDPKVQTDIKNADGKGKYKIAQIDNIYHEGMDTDELAAQLASGKDIWVAFTIDDDSWGFQAVKNGVIPDWTNGGGGHAVVLSGYRGSGANKQFLIHNSWTEKWGDGGYAWVSDKMVRQWLHAAYVIKVDDLASPPPPPPPPPSSDGRCPAGYLSDGSGPCMKACTKAADCDPSSTCSAVGSGAQASQQACVPNNPLTDDDCADDELVDSQTGRCAAMCDDGTRPAGGKCTAAAPASGPTASCYQDMPQSGTCPSGTKYFEGSCATACSADADCKSCGGSCSEGMCMSAGGKVPPKKPPTGGGVPKH